MPIGRKSPTSYISKTGLQNHYGYNRAMNTLVPPHPAIQWEQEARQIGQNPKLQLRLAAMAGHIRLDKVAARRSALVDLLADGRPHTREEIWQKVIAQLGSDCWGKRPHEALARDLNALRQGGVRIGYSRRPQTAGYYLQYPPLRSPTPVQFESINWTWVEHLRQLSGSEKNQLAFAAADLALRQKRLLLRKEQPDWSAEQVERESRRLVFGVA